MVDVKQKIQADQKDSANNTSPNSSDDRDNNLSGEDATKKSQPPVILPLAKEHMPKDYSVSLATYKLGGTDRFLNKGSVEGLKQSMRGFEPKYQNIIDYIVRITHKIWEEKDIGYIYDTYSHDCRVNDDSGLQYGRDKIVADTLHTTNAFPDIRLVADEIVWAGNDEVGFRSSHRVMILGHNTGHSKYGPPTGKRINVWCVANCVSLENEIFLEHVLYNTSSLVNQLGFDLKETAIKLAESNIASAPGDYMASEPKRLKGQGKPALMPMPKPAADGELDVVDFINTVYHNIWNRRMLGTLPRVYDKNLSFHGPTDRVFSGLGRYQAYVLSLLAMFPDLALNIDEVYWMGNAKEGYLSSTQWSASGTHRGYGIYGAPTNREVKIWGITQHKIVAGQITEEWMIFNELDLMGQIFSPAKVF